MEENFQIKSSTVAFAEEVVAKAEAVVEPVVEEVKPVVEKVEEAIAEFASKAVDAVEQAFTVGDAQEVAK